MAAEQAGTSPRDLALLSLPELTRTVLRLLLACLTRVSEVEENLMTANNLAVCFAPTVCEVEELEDANASFAALQVRVVMG